MTKHQTLNSSQLRARLEALVSPPTPSPTPVPAVTEHPYEELRLPPPRQFRDVPPPPEPFRDPPLPTQHPAGPIDNLLYHMYESVRDEVVRERNWRRDRNRRPQQQTNGEVKPP